MGSAPGLGDTWGMGANRSTTKAVVAMIVGLAIMALLMLLITAPVDGGGDVAGDQAGDLRGVPLEGEEFSMGGATSRAELIDDEGPLLLPDVASGDRDIWLQHIGDEAYTGWYAFSVRPDGETDRECFVEWMIDDNEFVDTCSSGIYRPDGSPADATDEVLPQYPVRINNGELLVDLRVPLEGEPGINRVSGSTP